MPTTKITFKHKDKGINDRSIEIYGYLPMLEIVPALKASGYDVIVERVRTEKMSDEVLASFIGKEGKA